MKNIRSNVFETNSSSTHSITMCSKHTYDQWENGILFFQDWYDDKQWYTFDEMIEHIRNKYGDEEAETICKLKETDIESFISYIHDYDFYTYKSYENFNDSYEHFSDCFTTDSGEIVIAFGYYGNNY